MDTSTKGIIYLMTTIVPGLIKIGRTGSTNFESRMYNLEHDGYRNVTGLKRAFAIEVDDYVDKETLLHTIFEKSQVADTELFSLDINVAIQLLSSFEGQVIYPVDETKSEIFDTATDNSQSRFIPDGEYYYKKKKKSDNRQIDATAVVKNGEWTIKKGSVIGVHEDVGVSKKAKVRRAEASIDENGVLLKDANLGACTPSGAGEFVLNSSTNGWTEWTTKSGKPIDIFRKRSAEE